MMKAVFDAVMERRSTRLLEQVGSWLPDEGPILDLGSGTGHLAARLVRERAVEVVAADVSDMHVMGPAPVVVTDGILPFDADTFSAALLVFMLHYPADPVALLAEVARVTGGPIILVQSVYSGRFGYAWLRVREFVWTTVAFHVSKVIGYVPAGAGFTMAARRFYTEDTLRQDLLDAGLRVRAHENHVVLRSGALVVSAWTLERND